jgi:hypothetical protein
VGTYTKIFHFALFFVVPRNSWIAHIFLTSYILAMRSYLLADWGEWRGRSNSNSQQFTNSICINTVVVLCCWDYFAFCKKKSLIDVYWNIVYTYITILNNIFIVILTLFIKTSNIVYFGIQDDAINVARKAIMQNLVDQVRVQYNAILISIISMIYYIHFHIYLVYL